MRRAFHASRSPRPARPEPWPQLNEECIEYARAADRLGFDYLVEPEYPVEVGYNPAPFVTLTALARETERTRLATQPPLLQLYNPVMVAEQSASSIMVAATPSSSHNMTPRHTAAPGSVTQE